MTVGATPVVAREGFLYNPFHVGIFFVFMPFQRIVPDIFPDCVQFGFIADDVFVIIALPDREPLGITDVVDHVCASCLERAHDFPDGRG
jgi:hypothetical protein